MMLLSSKPAWSLQSPTLTPSFRIDMGMEVSLSYVVVGAALLMPAMGDCFQLRLRSRLLWAAAGCGGSGRWVFSSDDLSSDGFFDGRLLLSDDYFIGCFYCQMGSFIGDFCWSDDDFIGYFIVRCFYLRMLRKMFYECIFKEKGGLAFEIMLIESPYKARNER